MAPHGSIVPLAVQVQELPDAGPVATGEWPRQPVHGWRAWRSGVRRGKQLATVGVWVRLAPG